MRAPILVIRAAASPVDAQFAGVVIGRPAPTIRAAAPASAESAGAVMGPRWGGALPQVGEKGEKGQISSSAGRGHEGWGESAGMGINGLIEDMNEIQRNLADLVAESTAEEQVASLDLVQKATRFSRQTREMVDDKLSFSATLMRAGEPGAAARVLGEVEEVVRDGKIALIETVNEVKVAQAARRGRITRLRLARTLVAAMLGASLLAFSAVGFGLASLFQGSEQGVALTSSGLQKVNQRERRHTEPAPGSVRTLRRLQIGDVEVLLTPNEFRRLAQLTGGSIDRESLATVVDLLKGTLREKIKHAFATASWIAQGDLADAVLDPTPVVKKLSRARNSASTETSQEQPSASEREAAQDQDADSESDPQPGTDPQPSSSGGDSNSESGSEEGRSVLGDQQLPGGV